MPSFTTNYGWSKPSGGDSPDLPTVVGGPLDAIDLTLRSLSAGALMNVKTFWSQSLSISTTSSTNVDITSMSMSWTKSLGSTASDVLLFMILGWRPTVAATTAAMIGINVGGVDTDLAASEATSFTAGHYQTMGFRVRTGVSSGVYTVQGRVRRFYGSGTITADSNDTYMMLVGEIVK